MSLRRSWPGRDTKPENKTEGFAFPRPTARPKKKPARLNAVRARERRSSYVEDPAYLDWLRRHRYCPAAKFGNCRGRMEASHVGPRGMGQRTSDRNAHHACATHARPGWHDHAVEPFKSWRKEQILAWGAEQVLIDNAEYLRQGFAFADGREAMVRATVEAMEPSR